VNVARNGFPYSIIVVIAALCVQIPLYCQRGSDSVDRSLAGIYLDRAIALHADGQDGPSLGLLEEALSLFGQSPDILYFMSKIDAPELSPGYSLRVSKVARLEAALALDGFGKFSREDAVYELAESLLRMKEYEKAAQVIRDNAAHPELEARSAFVLVSCDYLLKRAGQYRTGMAECLRRFPDDARFARFFLEHADKSAVQEGDRAVLSSISLRLEALAALDPEILVMIVPFTALKEDRVRLLKRYRSLGKGGRMSVIEAERYGLEPEDALLDEFWNGIDGTRKPLWRELREFYDLLGIEKNRAEFRKRLGGYSGDIAQEESGDGYVESVSRFKEGDLERWEYDPDQDGLIDVAIDFKDGLPSEARCLQEGKPISFSYDLYPSLRSAVYEREGGTGKLDFGGGGASLPILSFRLPFRAEGLSRIRESLRDPRIAVPTFDIAILMATTLEESIREEGGAMGLPHERKTITELSEGLPLRTREYLDGRLSRKRDYAQGMPSEEWFGYDQDADFWQGRIVYRRIDKAPYFRKAWLSMDENGDGLPEYKESYDPVLRKEWDFDGNGSFDVAEENDKDLISVYFSSKLNGEFDVRVDQRAGKIVKIRRYGKDYAVKKESKSDIYWIGRMAFELGSAAPKADGVYKKSGVRYLFYRSGKIAFAEVLP
jgi:hypothetical protein